MLIVLANREPLRREGERWVPSVGGLTTALLPVLEAQGGVWIAWGEADADAVPRIAYPEAEPRLEVRRLPLSEAEVTGYYYGLANRTLWPVCHYFTEQMDLKRAFYDAYSQVNWRFAGEAAAVYNEGDVVWIHDYHLMLTPGLLRKARPGARIGFFFHIPWPAAEVWRVLPWAQELTEGLLGADLIGFHNDEYVKNFLEAAEELAGAEVHGHEVHWNGREIRVEAHPIGIDTAHFRALSEREAVRAEAEKIRQDVRSEFILLGVDRLDYTKGVPERLLAFERFLELYPDYRGRTTFFQVSAPSRTRVESYRELKRTVDELAGRINGTYMEGDWVPVRYLYRNHTQEELVSLYLAADAALVTPVRDGMNVVAQEFAYTTEHGVLILSNLTGADRLLEGAFSVNPFDIEGVARTLGQTLELPQKERDTRLAQLKAKVEALDVHGWAERFLRALEAPR